MLDSLTLIHHIQQNQPNLINILTDHKIICLIKILLVVFYHCLQFFSWGKCYGTSYIYIFTFSGLLGRNFFIVSRKGFLYATFFSCSKLNSKLGCCYSAVSLCLFPYQSCFLLFIISVSQKLHKTNQTASLLLINDTVSMLTYKVPFLN